MSKIVFKDGQELHVTKEMADKVASCSNSGRVAFSVVDGNTEKNLALSMDDVLYVEFEKPVEQAAADSAPVDTTPSAPVDAAPAEPTAPAVEPAAPSDAAPATPAAPAEAPADPSAVPAQPAA